MRPEEFSALAYKDQLQMINRSGKLKLSHIANDYQVTLYKVKDFYVELKRNIHQLSFEKITAIHGHELPEEYRTEGCPPIKKDGYLAPVFFAPRVLKK